MSAYYEELLETLQERLDEAAVVNPRVACGELTFETPPERLLDTCRTLRDDDAFACAQLIDLCGVDYSEYGETPWEGPRYAVVYHLLSIRHNHRIRLKCFIDGEPPRIDSVIDIWASANWFEREAFDLFGILFEGHPDLRRILTDYGFVGHPFRKDFPLSGNVEMRYDPERQRVIYEPVTVEPRINQPRVIRHDNRYLDPASEESGDA